MLHHVSIISFKFVLPGGERMVQPMPARSTFVACCTVGLGAASVATRCAARWCRIQTRLLRQQAKQHRRKKVLDVENLGHLSMDICMNWHIWLYFCIRNFIQFPYYAHSFSDSISIFVVQKSWKNFFNTAGCWEVIGRAGQVPKRGLSYLSSSYLIFPTRFFSKVLLVFQFARPSNFQPSFLLLNSCRFFDRKTSNSPQVFIILRLDPLNDLHGPPIFDCRFLCHCWTLVVEVVQ